MHPDISRQLAAERLALAGFHRQAEANVPAELRSGPRRHRLRSGLRWALAPAYARRAAAGASAATGRRSGT
jgi:hypothetical protein